MKEQIRVGWCDDDSILFRLDNLKPFKEYVGAVDLAKDRMSSASDVANGQPLQYRITFPLQNPLPKPFEIYLNDQLLCSAAKGEFKVLEKIAIRLNFYIF